jgi:hypothetical protein
MAYLQLDTPKIHGFTVNQGLTTHILKSFAQSYPQDPFVKTHYQFS